MPMGHCFNSQCFTNTCIFDDIMQAYDIIYKVLRINKFLEFSRSTAFQARAVTV